VSAFPALALGSAGPGPMPGCGGVRLT
jgi:hypothetical protein